jgi:hypothetical protein
MAMPCRGPLDLTLSADQFQAALQFRLGLPLLSGKGELCSFCDGRLDNLGHHHVTCAHASFRNSRHDRLRDSLFRLLAAAGMSPESERGASDRDLSRPADLLVPSWKLGKPGAFDLTKNECIES